MLLLSRSPPTMNAGRPTVGEQAVEAPRVPPPRACYKPPLPREAAKSCIPAHAAPHQQVSNDCSGAVGPAAGVGGRALSRQVRRWWCMAQTETQEGIAGRKGRGRRREGSDVDCNLRVGRVAQVLTLRTLRHSRDQTHTTPVQAQGLKPHGVFGQRTIAPRSWARQTCLPSGN